MKKYIVCGVGSQSYLGIILSACGNVLQTDGEVVLVVIPEKGTKIFPPTYVLVGRRNDDRQSDCLIVELPKFEIVFPGGEVYPIAYVYSPIGNRSQLIQAQDACLSGDAHGILFHSTDASSVGMCAKFLNGDLELPAPKLPRNHFGPM